MKLPRPLTLALLAGGLLLGGCRPQDKGHATPEAAAELALISSYLPEVGIDEVLELPTPEEVHQLMSDFAASADATLLSRPSGISMLHLACLFKKPELARCLLIDKADANAVTATGETPLSLAVSMRGVEDDATDDEAMLSLIDTLLAGGADITRRAPDDSLLLNYTGLNSFSEKVFLHLLDKGAPYDETTCQAPAMMGWNTALKRLLGMGVGKSPHALETMLLMAAANLHEDTVQLLLDAGADVNAHQISGTTPLLEAAGHLLSPAEEEEAAHVQKIVNVCALLIQRGADPYLAEIRQDGSPAFCAADILAKDAAILRALEEQGVTLRARTVTFSAGIPLLEEIGKATVLEQTPDASAFEAIARALAPTEEMRQHPLYHEVLPMAVELLHQIDPVRTSAQISAMPMWTGQEAWRQNHGECLLPALTKCEQIVLPKAIICSTAEHLATAGQSDQAAYMIELLSRCPDATVEIEQYCNHSSRAIQAGAWGARLRQAGLPTPRDGDVELWLDNHNIAPSTPELQKAVLLTSLSRMWYGDMLPGEQEQMMQAMEEIGAKEAAAHYRAIAAAMNDPETLDKLTADSDSWKFELEIATAQYIHTHSAAFLDAAKQITD